MQYAPLTGLADLRECVAAYVAEDGVRCTPDDVLITNGAKHATELALMVFAEPGDKVIVTSPTYMTTLQCFRNHGVDLLGIPMDGAGMRVDILEGRLKTIAANGDVLPKLLFDVPDFHNPTGITMSLERRRALLELALEYEFVILEDDPYRRLRFEGEAIPPIKSLDQHGVVIAIGTVSKILAPGLRVGWAIADSEIVRRMALRKSDGGSAPLNQRIVASLMRSNKMREHIVEVSAQMKRHRDVMVEALAEHLPAASVRAPSGGYFLWARLPEASSAQALVRRGIERGVEVSAGRVCFPDADPGHFLRFAYSFVGPDEILEGIRRLGLAYGDVMGE